ncbi:aldehyde dehydrogenase family protein [Rhabdothermincola sediminis]|uniref:aldehyde dehydrogenase family protein n=1 Tax=Rhabdothermincola sediminis TaxID=2751370 RepID=UPI001AA0736E|nr:aldehyde dehydrogenase family protein [Rhabdothermincola sediminis]
MADYQLFIDGAFTDAASGETFATYNPGTGQKLADLPKAGRDDAIRAIEAARKAFDEGPWPKMSGAERAAKLRRIVELINQHSAELAELEALDSGGTILKAQMADVPGAVSAFEWFARMAEERPDRVDLEGSPFPVSQNYIRYEPIGVCTGIIPWNFPLIMAAWKIAPALAAGNTSVLKPASLTSLSALKLAQIIAEADLPPGVVNILAGPGGTVGEELASNPLVDKTAFTGSTEVGRRIMQLASGTVKAVTLELGGKSANIVLDDADLDLAAAGVLWGTFFHGGQVCESGTRALVQRGIYDEFISLLVEKANNIVVGDQMEMTTNIGPLVSRGQVETVERYVKLGRDEVGEPLCGGGAPDNLPDHLDKGAFYRPTIFADVDNKAKIAQEEIFGPVLCVIPFDTDDEAVAIANDSIYGLAGGVQSGNIERAEAVAARMRTGTVWINDYHLISPERPFGGYKQSGIGRELGTQGYDIYRQVKHVHINPETSGRDNHFHYGVLGV